MNEKSKRISYKMIAIVYALLFIALAMASAIGEYNNYEVQQYPVYNAENWITDALATTSINVSVIDLENAYSSIAGLHGNAIWIEPTYPTSWNALREQLNGSIQEGKQIGAMSTNGINITGYSLMLRSYQHNLNNLNSILQNNQLSIAFQPIYYIGMGIMLMAFFSMIFFIMAWDNYTYGDSKGWFAITMIVTFITWLVIFVIYV